VNGHDQQHVDLVQKRLEQIERRGRIQSEADPTAGVANLLQCFADIVFRFRFDVNGIELAPASTNRGT